MKKILAIGSSLLLACSVMLTGCSTAPDKAYTISIDGVDIIVGETKVEEFYKTDYILDAEEGQMLEKDTYYSYIHFYNEEEEDCGYISILSEEDAPLEDAIIAEIEIDSDVVDMENVAERISIEGVKLSELTLEKAKEMFKGANVSEDGVTSPTDKYYIGVHFNEDGSLKDFKHERKYDVDWNGDGK